MDFETLAQRRNAIDSMLRAIFASPVTQRHQLFGLMFFLERLDCKNFAFDPDKLRDFGVCITNEN